MSTKPAVWWACWGLIGYLGRGQFDGLESPSRRLLRARTLARCRHRVGHGLQCRGGRLRQSREGVPMNARLLRKINTEHVNPPIPLRSYDWSATFDGYEPGDSIGYGRTEQEAIDWLIAEEAHIIASEHDNKEPA